MAMAVKLPNLCIRPGLFDASQTRARFKSDFFFE